MSLLFVGMGIGCSLLAAYYGVREGLVLLAAGAIMSIPGTIVLWVEFAEATKNHRKWLEGLALVTLYFLGCYVVIQNSGQPLFRLACTVVMLALLIFSAEVLSGQVKVLWKEDH